MSSSRPWVKVWETWWKSRSHDDLDAHALLVGLRLLSVAQAAPVLDEDEETRWCLNAAGEPKSLAGLARECRLTVGQISKAIDALARADTIVRREDGAVGFPRWNRYQLSPSAIRMRRHRERTPASTDPVTVTPDVDAKRTEDRGQREQPPNPRKRGSDSTKARSRSRESNPDLVANANTVIDRLNERRAWISEKYQLPGVQTFRHAKGNRIEITRLLDEGETVDRLLLVVDAAAREVAVRRGEGLQWLTPITPFRAANWPRYLGKIGAPQRVNGRVADPSIETPEQAQAWADVHGGDAPAGWVWQPDRRGEFELVRSAEAAE